MSSRTRSKTRGLDAPSRSMVTETWVPLGPLRREATAAESMPSVDLPSMETMTSPGRMPALKDGRAFEGGEDDDLGGAVFVGLGLDAHADAVVLAVLVFAHLGEGLGVIEVGVGVQGVEHARDGAVVDGLVGLVGVQLVGVVLLDDGVDVGEGPEAVAQGGLVGWRTGRRPSG